MSSFLSFVFFETVFQIAQRLKTMAFVFTNPAFVNLVQRHWIQIMQLLASAPNDRHQVRSFQQNQMFGQQMARAFANNGDFIINAIESMAGGSALADLRGRGISWRPFELIQRMETDANDRYRAKEQELSQQLRETEQKLTQLPKAAEGAGELLSPEQSKAIEGFRAQMLRIRSELRDVQFALRRDVDSLKNWITAINVGVVPVTAAIIVLVFALRRPRRSPATKGEGATPDDRKQGEGTQP